MTANESLVVGAVFIGGIAFLWRTHLKGKEEINALIYWLNAAAIYDEACDNPFMSARKWHLLAQVLDEADLKYGRTHPELISFTRYGALARKRAKDGESPHETIGSL